MVIWIIAAIAAGFIKGLCGVGDAPVFSAIMSFAANNIDISPVSVVPSLLTNIIIVTDIVSGVTLYTDDDQLISR